MSKPLAALGAINVVAVALALVLYKGGIPGEITAAIVAGLFGAFPLVAARLEQQGKTRHERIEELIKGDIGVHPALAVVYILCYLQFIERTLGAIFGAALGMGLGLSGQDDRTIHFVIRAVGPLFVTLLTMFAIIPIAKHTTHRVRRLPFLWLAIAIIIDQAINIGVAAILFELPVLELIGPQLVVALLLLPGAFVGYLWARRSHAAYIMMRLFRQISPADQRSLIDLVGTLPGASAR